MTITEEDRNEFERVQKARRVYMFQMLWQMKNKPGITHKEINAAVPPCPNFLSSRALTELSNDNRAEYRSGGWFPVYTRAQLKFVLNADQCSAFEDVENEMAVLVKLHHRAQRRQGNLIVAGRKILDQQHGEN